MMKCFLFRSRHDLRQNVNMWPERIVVLNALSLSFFFTSFLSFQQQAKNVLILTRDTLSPNQSKRTASIDDGVGELCILCINRPQQRPSPHIQNQ